MKILILFAASALSFFAKAQTKEGKVIYERITQMPVRSFGNMPAELQAQIPKSRTEQFELLFTPQHSLFQFLPNAADEGGGTFSSGGMVIRMSGGANETTYVDFEKATKTDQREVMEKSFLVSDTLAKQKWKLSDETKTILNFTARKATTTSINTRMRMTMENGEMKREPLTDTAVVVAWYTTDVPVPAGPSYMGQLPGLILEVNVGNGQSVTKAIEFSPKIAATKIKEPKDGKKLTAAEFSKEREKMMEEMRKNMPA
ncbi:MAG: GLPGLI family protein, partial [Bacteroidota bacterium]|nr:GLPGLI family protein [Bacteroidota bacterium]